MAIGRAQPTNRLCSTFFIPNFESVMLGSRAAVKAIPYRIGMSRLRILEAELVEIIIIYVLRGAADECCGGMGDILCSLDITRSGIDKSHLMHLGLGTQSSMSPREEDA